MKSCARIQKRLILLIAFSIIWIFIGSLVVFHQEQVLGKVFKFNTITYIVPKSKDEKTFQKGNTETSKDLTQNLILAVMDESARELLLSAGFSIIVSEGDQQPVPVFLSRSPGLRAPPLA
jgi:hypothetical protein